MCTLGLRCDCLSSVPHLLLYHLSASVCCFYVCGDGVSSEDALFGIKHPVSPRNGAPSLCDGGLIKRARALASLRLRCSRFAAETAPQRPPTPGRGAAHALWGGWSSSHARLPGRLDLCQLLDLDYPFSEWGPECPLARCLAGVDDGRPSRNAHVSLLVCPSQLPCSRAGFCCCCTTLLPRANGP